MNMHAAKFSTAGEGWNALARIQQRLGVNSSFQSKKLLEFFTTKLQAHGVELFHANPMLTGHGTAGSDAGLQYFCAHGHSVICLPGHVGVEEH